MGQDPIFLPKVAHMLDIMYEGGYSAVIYFQNFYGFPIHKDD